MRHESIQIKYVHLANEYLDLEEKMLPACKSHIAS